MDGYDKYGRRNRRRSPDPRDLTVATRSGKSDLEYRPLKEVQTRKGSSSAALKQLKAPDDEELESLVIRRPRRRATESGTLVSRGESNHDARSYVVPKIEETELLGRSTTEIWDEHAAEFYTSGKDVKSRRERQFRAERLAATVDGTVATKAMEDRAEQARIGGYERVPYTNDDLPPDLTAGRPSIQGPLRSKELREERLDKPLRSALKQTLPSNLAALPPTSSRLIRGSREVSGPSESPDRYMTMPSRSRTFPASLEKRQPAVESRTIGGQSSRFYQIKDEEDLPLTNQHRSKPHRKDLERATHHSSKRTDGHEGEPRRNHHGSGRTHHHSSKGTDHELPKEERRSGARETDAGSEMGDRRVRSQTDDSYRRGKKSHRPDKEAYRGEQSQSEHDRRSSRQDSRSEDHFEGPPTSYGCYRADSPGYY